MSLNKVIELRKRLHKHPELSGDEFNTQKSIIDFLNQNAPNGTLMQLGKTGFAMVYGKSHAKTVLVRGDMDALPIYEINDFDYKSENEGVGHKCGHDGHSAILCNTALHLSENLPEKGRVALIFQPAEEIGEGAKSILAHADFEKVKPDACYALHNIPGYEMGKIIYREGAFTPAVVSLILRINGKTAHAAEPENGTNPAYTISKILLESEALVNPDVNSEAFTVITPTHGMFGDTFAYGTAAGYGELRLTIRAWSNVQLDKSKNALIKLVEKIEKAEDVTIEKEWTQEFRANMNDSQCVANVVEAAKQNDLKLEERKTPFKWGEDFGLFTEHIRGCMFGIGAGLNCPGLHNPDYDFPDEIIPLATNVFLGVINKELS